MQPHDRGKRGSNRSSNRRRKMALDKLLKKATKGGAPIDTGRSKIYTFEEANAAREEREMDQQRKRDNMTPVEKEALKGAQMRYDSLAEQMEPYVEVILHQQQEMTCQAIYHIVGDRLDISHEMIMKMFGWITVIKHPLTGVLDASKNYKVFTFYGDGNQEVFKGDLKQPDPKMLIWHRYESPPIYYDKENPKMIIGVGNLWKLLIEPVEYAENPSDMDKNN